MYEYKQWRLNFYGADIEKQTRWNKIKNYDIMKDLEVQQGLLLC
jgi:hypothetical protein